MGHTGRMLLGFKYSSVSSVPTVLKYSCILQIKRLTPLDIHTEITDQERIFLMCIGYFAMLPSIGTALALECT
jgi:hypothetical protein